MSFNISDVQKIITVEPDQLVIDPSVSSAVFSKALSPSTLNAMNGCHARYAIGKALGTLGTIPVPPSAPQKIGQSVHSILEKLMLSDDRSPAQMERIFSDLLASDGIEHPPMTDEAEFDEWSKTVLKLANALYAIEDPATVDVLGVESRIQLDLWDVPINGFVDRIDRVDGGLRIVDYKTGKVPRSHDDFDRQLVIYAEAISALYGEPVVEACDYFLINGTVHSVALSKARVSITRRAAREVWKTIGELRATMRFDYQPDALCGWCPLVTQCPAAKANGYVARTPEAEVLEGIELNSANCEPIDNTSSDTKEKENPMQDDTKPTAYGEDKKWVPIRSNGEINLGSYAADNANRIASLAIRVATNSCQGTPRNAELLDLARLFKYIIDRAAKEAVNASNEISMDTSLWTMTYYTFNTWLTTHSVNFDNVEEWAYQAISEVSKAIRLTKRVLIDSYEDIDFDPADVVFREDRWS
jgi:RecB family exonuclease